jgi:hypothetical protein
LRTLGIAGGAAASLWGTATAARWAGQQAERLPIFGGTAAPVAAAVGGAVAAFALGLTGRTVGGNIGEGLEVGAMLAALGSFMAMAHRIAPPEVGEHLLPWTRLAPELGGGWG